MRFHFPSFYTVKNMRLLLFFGVLTFIGLSRPCVAVLPPDTVIEHNNNTAEGAPSCQLFGDIIRAHKPEDGLPGKYGQREDVKAFAQQVAQCHQLDYLWVLDTLTQAKYQASTARFIMPQPAGTRNWGKFVSNFVQPDRINRGVIFWQNNKKWLEQAEKDFGVPPKIVLGILGVETIYGQITGNFRIIDALSTLSFDFPSGRSDRRDYFSGELAAFLAFTAKDGVDPLSIRGSYAGAMGMPQFMPTSLRTYAIDYDGDGYIDLNASPADIIGSVAHYLAMHHWQAGIPSSFTPQMHGATQSQIDYLKTSDIVPTFTVAEMAMHGVSMENRTKTKQLSSNEVKLSFIALENGTENPPTYVIGTQNFFVITRYNRSSFYAMSVIELANAIERAYQKKNR